jgi:hypothetical protein
MVIKNANYINSNALMGTAKFVAHIYLHEMFLTKEWQTNESQVVLTHREEITEGANK